MANDSIFNSGLMSGRDIFRNNLGVETLYASTIKNGREMPYPGNVANHHFALEDFDDNKVDDTALWAEAGDTSFAVTPQDEANGVVAIITDANDNDEVRFHKVTKNFLFAAKKIWFQARVFITEAASNSANIFVGLSDLDQADFMADNGAGLNSNYTGAGFFKVDGGTVWQFQISDAATPSTDTNVGAFVSGSWNMLEFEYEPYPDGTTAIVTPYVNGVKGGRLSISLTAFSGDELFQMFDLKAGTAAAETLKIDFVNIISER